MRDEPEVLVTAEGRIGNTGGGWYTVDVGAGQPVRVRGRAAALDAAGTDGLTVETFRGPSRQITLQTVPDPSSVAVERDGQPVDVEVDGRTLERTRGHFGRGRWTVTYRTA